MHSITEKKLILYACLFLTIILNISKLLALREDGLIAQYWHFNAGELLFQSIWNFIFCMGITYFWLLIPVYLQINRRVKILLLSILSIIIISFTDVAGITVQKRVFNNATPDKIFFAGYSTRIIASSLLVFILVRVILLLRESKAKDKENERLQNAYLNAQLVLLKEELNPHFFFNALSSLSAIIRENPKQAQQYISHLSKIFRYTLNTQKQQLVTLQQELTVFDSYSALMKMRMEEGLSITINIPDEYLEAKLPYMTLQPLLENAGKHNAYSTLKPLCVSVYVSGLQLVMENNIQAVHFNEATTATGLANLNERFRILMQKEISIEKNDEIFSVKLPLQTL